MADNEAAPRGDYSITELRGLMAGETPAAAANKETPAEGANAGDGAASTETAPASESEQTTQEGTEDGRERGADGKFKAKEEDGTPAGVQKRIDKAVKAQREAERRAEEAERKLAETQGSRPAGAQQGTETNAQKPAEAKAKPEVKDFDDYDKYLEALTEWNVDQRELKRERERVEKDARDRVEKINRAHQQRVTAAREQHADFDEVVAGAKGINVSQPAIEALVESEHSGELLYSLCSNTDEAKRIAALSPARQVAEIGKLESRFEAPPANAAPAKRQLPKPPANVGGSTGAAKEPELHDSKLSMSEFKKRAATMLRR